MADRPRSEDPDDRTGEYRWLYGQQPPAGGEATRATPQQPRQPRPDETRVMPTQPRPPAARPSQPVARPVAPPPPARARTYGGSRFRRPGLWWRALLVLLLLWLVYLVAVPLLAWSKVDKVAFEPSGDRPGEQPGTTYLMVGSDSRSDLSPQERKRLGTGNAEGQRTDTIMLLHTGDGPNLLLSIPRDSLVEIPGQGRTKINAAFALGGPKLLVRTLEQATGIRIDQYVEIGFGGFVDLVDAVGGISICPKQKMDDRQAKLHIKKGCQPADGATALAYARSRKTYTGLGDIERARAQREVVSSIGDKVISPWSVLNPVRYWRLNMAASQAVVFGDGASPWRATAWALAMTRVNGDSGLTCGVPISDLAVNWDPERSKRLFQLVIDDNTADIGKSLCTQSGLPGR